MTLTSFLGQRETKPVAALSLIVPHARPRSPNLLPPEDDNVPPPVPVTLRGLTAPLPKLPPTHTYLRTPVSDLIYSKITF